MRSARRRREDYGRDFHTQTDDRLFTCDERALWLPNVTRFCGNSCGTDINGHLTRFGPQDFPLLTLLTTPEWLHRVEWGLHLVPLVAWTRFVQRHVHRQMSQHDVAKLRIRDFIGREPCASERVRQQRLFDTFCTAWNAIKCSIEHSGLSPATAIPAMHAGLPLCMCIPQVFSVDTSAAEARIASRKQRRAAGAGLVNGFGGSGGVGVPVTFNHPNTASSRRRSPDCQDGPVDDEHHGRHLMFILTKIVDRHNEIVTVCAP